MRCLPTSQLLLLIGSVIQVSQPAVALSTRQGVRQECSTYRGRPLRFYLAQVRTENLRAQAFRSIGSFGSQGAPALSWLNEGLHDPVEQVRIAAAWAISQVAPPRDEATVKALATALSDESPQVRSLSAVALRQIGPGAADAVVQLIVALDDPVSFVRAPAAEALGKIGHAARTAVEPLSKRLRMKDEQIFVLRSISYALGDIGPDALAALPALEEALKMVRVSYAAQSAILKIQNLPIATY